MKYEGMLTLSGEEVQRQIPYALICETHDCSVWGTMRRKRRWAEEFTEAERNVFYRLFKQARMWHLIKGVPDEVVMTAGTFANWIKLGKFCGSL